MRSGRSLGPDYFEDMFRQTADPWGFRTSPYERTKYDHTIAALDGRRYRNGFEIGCANGVLTRRLAAICDTLLAIDVSETALAQAEAHCAGLANVRFEKRSFPGTAAEDACFDLIVLSEVAYYWDDHDLARAAVALCDRLEHGGHLLLVHWTGETDYPQSGDDAVAKLFRGLGDAVTVVTAERQPEYRLDLWRRR